MLYISRCTLMGPSVSVRSYIINYEPRMGSQGVTLHSVPRKEPVCPIIDYTYTTGVGLMTYAVK